MLIENLAFAAIFALHQEVLDEIQSYKEFIQHRQNEEELLTKRDELISKCRHLNNYYASRTRTL